MIVSFTLYFIMALTGAIAAFLGTDEAAKYIAPEPLFWYRGINGVVLTVSTVLKGYTSEAYAKWRGKQTTDNNNENKTSPP